ncbi:helix-turn-helix transcriptional regulator [Haladaptatus sp. NG-SE-30]
MLRSGARTAVLLSIADGRNSTQELLSRDLASESAVYNALTELDDCDLVYAPQTKRWAVTGTGSVVAALIRRQQETEEVLRIDTEYWQQHDVTALPDPFRFRLSDLLGGTVVRATATQPSRAEREVERRLREADCLSVISPIYNERYSEALYEGVGDSRLVLDANVHEDLLADETFEAKDEEHLGIRLSDVSFALGVMEGGLLLSLPTLDGSYDGQTEFVAETERAVRWGRELFDHVWNAAIPLEEYS